MANDRKRMPRPTPVAELMESVFRGTAAEQRLREGRIWLLWDAVVGPQIAARARPARFSAGVLSVAVASAPWMQQLTFLKRGLMERLNAALGEPLVTDIYLLAGRPEAPAPVTKPPSRKPPLSAADRARIARDTAGVDDPELRAAFGRLLARHLQEQGKE
ncbi:MAG TPA: DciA family protein [Geobacteraceae bacterium]